MPYQARQLIAMIAVVSLWTPFPNETYTSWRWRYGGR
jgi:hypothetical protein